MNGANTKRSKLFVDLPEFAFENRYMSYWGTGEPVCKVSFMASADTIQQ